MNVAEKVKKLRLDKNMSQAEFAKKCELAQSTISYIETGINTPSLTTLQKICKNFNLNISYFD